LGAASSNYVGWKRLGVWQASSSSHSRSRISCTTLKGLDTAKILAAMAAKSTMQIAMATLCVIGAFCTLTFYDYFALKTIGKKHVPYRIAALSSFTSYTIGHNLGATVFTGGAIRFRIYSDYGLNAIDVAKICFISGLTFWLGNTFVLGFGMIWHPQAASAIDLLPNARQPADRHRHVSAGIVGYLVWLSVGKRAPRTWSERLESGSALGAQADAAADRHRRDRSRLLCTGDVSADTRAALYRFRLAGGGVHFRYSARLCQPCAGQPRRVRRRHAGGAAAVQARRNWSPPW
jgi:uncharacterized membrane protein YbhN (UPF0104 family)